MILTAEVCGTPGYLAPEIIECSMDPNHAGYDTAVDMWVVRIDLLDLYWLFVLSRFWKIFPHVHIVVAILRICAWLAKKD